MIATVRKAILYASLTAALFLSGLFVIFTPLPLTTLLARGRRWRAASAALLAIGIIAGLYVLLFGWISAAAPRVAWLTSVLPFPGVSVELVFGRSAGIAFAATYFGMFLATAWAIGEGLCRQWRPERITGGALLAVFGCLAVALAAARFLGGVEIWQGAQTYFTALATQFIDLQARGGLAPDEVAVLRSHVPMVVQSAVRILPALAWTTGLYIAVLNLIGARFLLCRSAAMQHVPPFRTYRAPFGWIWLLIGAGFAFIADHWVFRTGWLATIGLNGIGVGCSVVFLQGLAVTHAVLMRWPLWWKWIGYALLVLWIHVAIPALVVIGIADAWIDVRGRWTTRRVS
ncbi:MAG: DUF2232 domain-containing protein [Deltaproteobacteria bacterium]|nr:DUF2232 domain-containing protein [Deltaproteobacteria bacterium]